MSKFTILTMTILVTITTSSGQIIGHCGVEQSEKFDSCANKLFVIGNETARFADSVPSMNRWCSNAKEAVKCIKDFSKQCLTSLTKQANNLLAYGANKHVKKVCKTKNSRAEAYQNLACLNKNYGNMNREMYKLVDNCQRGMNGNNSQKISLLCCKFIEFRKSANQEATRTCTAKQSQYFDTFISSFASDILDMLCSSYVADPSKCTNMVLPQKDSSIKRTLSPMPPLLLAMSNI
ncbi:hypothetical protein HDE_07201 [Halotydeus destructor]|nr:hypothetical protein HDE_07201 [Halotydeus destructor]